MLIRIMIRIQEFLTEFLPLRDRDNCKNFPGSVALTEICGIRMLQFEMWTANHTETFLSRLCYDIPENRS